MYTKWDGAEKNIKLMTGNFEYDLEVQNRPQYHIQNTVDCNIP